MVVRSINYIHLFYFCTLFTLLLNSAFANMHEVNATACDTKKAGDDKLSCENRAIDKACLEAVKKIGIIQNKKNNLSEQSINVIAYQIIDEYMYDIVRKITETDDSKICAEVRATIDIDDTELDKLVEMQNDYVTSNSDEVQDVVDVVNDTVKFEPENIAEKKLVFIKDMKFYEGSTTNQYSNILKETWKQNAYFLITDDESIADFIVSPYVSKSEIQEINSEKNKMQISLSLQVTSPLLLNFEPIEDVQNHFMLYEKDKDEQKLGDELIKRLLIKSADNIAQKINGYLQNMLKEEKLHNKKVE